MVFVLHHRESVQAAVEEFDHLGRETFLQKYGFGRARQYFLLVDGRLYDSKAICGVAYGIDNPSNGPLRPANFSGGEATVARQLESLGFTVVRGRGPAQEQEEALPLVLVENEVTYEGNYDHWQDQTGVQYQYPNQYRNRIQPGRRFVYYRGVRRAQGRRGAPEYFGSGLVGRVWRDPSVPETAPKRGWKWFCELENYQPFALPVPAKNRGKYFEFIDSALGWRTGVREIGAGHAPARVATHAPRRADLHSARCERAVDDGQTSRQGVGSPADRSGVGPRPQDRRPRPGTVTHQGPRVRPGADRPG